MENNRRSVVIHGLKTSVSVEEVFWNHLKAICSVRGIRIVDYIIETAEKYEHENNLSKSIRIRLFTDLLEDRKKRK